VVLRKNIRVEHQIFPCVYARVENCWLWTEICGRTKGTWFM